MKRIARNPKRFNVIELFASLARAEGFRLDSADDSDAFIEMVRESLGASKQNDRVLHGKRVEALFAYVAGALGKCRMIKSEDAGDIFVTGDPVQPPDYRIILNDSSQLLIEVKSCFNAHPLDRFVLKNDYVKQLKNYADMHGVPLMIAVYFGKYNRWSLLSLEDFETRNNKLEITMISALAKNRMAQLGDLTIATVPDLRLELLGDVGEAEAIDDQGRAAITIRSTGIYSAGVKLDNDLDQRIAFYLMQYGDWNGSSEAIVEGGKLLGLRFLSTPEHVHEDQEFVIIGDLSSMISSAYAERTVENQKLIAIDVEVDPEVLALRIPVDYQSSNLKLWRFEIRSNPNFKDRISRLAFSAAE